MDDDGDTTDPALAKTGTLPEVCVYEGESGRKRLMEEERERKRERERERGRVHVDEAAELKKRHVWRNGVDVNPNIYSSSEFS